MLADERGYRLRSPPNIAAGALADGEGMRAAAAVAIARRPRPSADMERRAMITDVGQLLQRAAARKIVPQA